jgi:hypothetical protein
MGYKQVVFQFLVVTSVKWLSSGMLRRIIWQIENDILEAFVASIITSFADYVTQHTAKKYLHTSRRENL